MSRVLVAYACYFGRARAIAERLADRLRARGHEVEVANARDGRLPPPQDYDAVILGSQVMHGHHARVIEDYVRTWRDELDQMPTAFFTGHTAPLEASKLADLVTGRLADAPSSELSPLFGPI